MGHPWSTATAAVCLALLVALCAAQTTSTDPAGSHLAELILDQTAYSAFIPSTFASSIASVLSISTSRVFVVYFYPYPILTLGTPNSGVRLQIYDGDGRTGLQEIEVLQNLVRDNSSYLISSGVRIDAIVSFRTPAPPTPDSSSSSDDLSTGAIVGIVFGSLVCVCCCATVVALIVFMLRRVKNFVDSKRHRSHDDLEEDSLADLDSLSSDSDSESDKSEKKSDSSSDEESAHTEPESVMMSSIKSSHRGTSQKDSMPASSQAPGSQDGNEDSDESE